MANENDTIFDEGTESTPTVNGTVNESEASIFANDTAPEPKVDSADETKAPDSTDAEPIAEEDVEGDKVSDDKSTEDEAEGDKAEESKDEPPKTAAELIAFVDKEIANDKHPAYYQHGLKSIKTAFLGITGEIEKTYEPLKDYGDVAKITENLEIIQGLESIETDPGTNLPVRTVKPFVSRLVEKKGLETAVDVMMELGRVASPTKQGWTLIHDVINTFGLNPERIADYKKFAENGYQIGNAGNPAPDPVELEQIPENLREAYISMTPAERAKIAPDADYDDEGDVSFRNRTLKAIQSELDNELSQKADEQSKAEREATETIQAQQKFYQDIYEKTETLCRESGERLHTVFVDSLVNAELDRFDVLNIANTMSVILNGAGAEAKASIAALEEIGVKLDPQIKTLYGEWQNTAQAVATFERQAATATDPGAIKQAKADYEISVNHFNDLQEKLERKSKPIVAAIVKYRADQTANRITSNNKAIDASQQFNNGTSPNEGKAATVSTGSFVPQGFTDADYDKIQAFPD